MIWDKINNKVWEYKTRQEEYALRDLAYMCLMYLSTCRASELCRARLIAGNKLSVKKEQFFYDGKFLKFRDAIILKRREPILDKKGHSVIGPKGYPLYQAIQSLENYPKRIEIPLPLEGALSIFTIPIEAYLKTLRNKEELFKFRYTRGWQIVNNATGEMQHYLRDMGLKQYSRLLDRNINDLIHFSGHSRMENLVKYLGEGNLERKLLAAKI